MAYAAQSVGGRQVTGLNCITMEPTEENAGRMVIRSNGSQKKWRPYGMYVHTMVTEVWAVPIPQNNVRICTIVL